MIIYLVRKSEILQSNLFCYILSFFAQKRCRICLKNGKLPGFLSENCKNAVVKRHLLQHFHLLQQYFIILYNNRLICLAVAIVV